MEINYPKIKADAVLGITGPPNITDDRAQKLADAIANAVKDPDYLSLAKKQKVQVKFKDSKAYYQYARELKENAEKVLRATGDIK